VADDYAGGNVQACVQVGAVASVVVGLPLQAPRSGRIGAVQRLDLGLFVHDNTMAVLGQVQVQPDHVAEFSRRTSAAAIGADGDLLAVPDRCLLSTVTTWASWLPAGSGHGGIGAQRVGEHERANAVVLFADDALPIAVPRDCRRLMASTSPQMARKQASSRPRAALAIGDRALTAVAGAGEDRRK
jgi:hypothetical protein